MIFFHAWKTGNFLVNAIHDSGQQDHVDATFSRAGVRGAVSLLWS